MREQMSWSNRMSGIQYTARRVSDAGLAVDAEVRAGDEVRFHVRDATAAKNDLDLQLRRYALERAYSGAASSIEACLVIPCVGRGRLLFGESGSDTRTIGAALGGQAAVGGFFANGELGPVGRSSGARRRRCIGGGRTSTTTRWSRWCSGRRIPEDLDVTCLCLLFELASVRGCAPSGGWRFIVGRSRRRRPARGALPEMGPAGVSYGVAWGTSGFFSAAPPSPEPQLGSVQLDRDANMEKPRARWTSGSRGHVRRRL